MLKVPWIYIPIFVFVILLIIAIIIIIAASASFNGLQNKLTDAMKELCSEDQKIKYVIPDIEPFKPDLSYHPQNSYSLFMINRSVSAWSGCSITLPVIKNFDLKLTFQALDTKANQLRDIGVCYYSDQLNMAIISFSGTRFLSEWYDDFDYTQQHPDFLTNKDVLIHRGHYLLYNSMRNKIITGVRAIINTGSTVVITGHSLGGSLASIAFSDFVSNNIVPKVTLYSFAAPRTGNNAYADIVNSSRTSYRVYNTEDIVPQLILPIMGQNIYYEHYGTGISFTNNLLDYSKNHIESYGDYLASVIGLK